MSEITLDEKIQRIEFEKIFTKEKGWDLTWIGGCYQHPSTIHAWAGWKASAENQLIEKKLNPPVSEDKTGVLLDLFQKTRVFKYFYTTLLRFDECLNCFIATEHWRQKEADLLTAAWWMFVEVQNALAQKNTVELHLVWNESKEECVGFLDKKDARYTATGYKGALFGVPTLGESFREVYDENEKFETQIVMIEAQGGSHE